MFNVLGDSLILAIALVFTWLVVRVIVGARG